jgi:hypothetical protein
MAFSKSSRFNRRPKRNRQPAFGHSKKKSGFRILRTVQFCNDEKNNTTMTEKNARWPTLRMSAILWVMSSWFLAEPNMTTAGRQHSGDTGRHVTSIQSGRANFGSIPANIRSFSKDFLPVQLKLLLKLFGIIDIHVCYNTENFTLCFFLLKYILYCYRYCIYEIGTDKFITLKISLNYFL